MQSEKNIISMKGITLIALVVTIVVLLILAAVSIGMLTGENGIIKQASESKELTRAGNVIEIRDLWRTNNKIGETTNEYKTLESLLKEIGPSGEKILTEEEVNQIKETGKVKIADKIIDFGTEMSYLTDAVILTVNTSSDNCIYFSVDSDSEFEIDFGDGVKVHYPTETALTEDTKKIGKIADFSSGIKVAAPGEPIGHHSINHEYDEDGEYIIKITGKIDTLYYVQDTLREINSWGKMQLEAISFYCNEGLEKVAKTNEKSFAKNIKICVDNDEFNQYGFYGCSNLTSIDEEFLIYCTEITDMSYTFHGCTSLTTAPVIPDSVTDMGYTFFGCTSLTTAPVIPNSVTNMWGTFYECTSLTTAPVIPNSVTDMYGTFSGCTNLTTAPIIPNNVTDMENTFSGCISLTTAPVIPNSVTDMGGTFSGCTSLTTAPVIPNSVTDMGSTFSGCTSLTTEPVIPNSVTYMGYTFSGCTSLTTAPVIPNSVTNMYGTFRNCVNLIGTVEINCNPIQVNYCFSNAATNTSGLKIIGTTTLKSQFAATGTNITY